MATRTTHRTVQGGMAPRLLGPLALAALAVASGCDNAGQGAFTGAGLGAASGAIIGSLTGSAGKGALIGAAAGAVGGAVIGDQNERNARKREY